MESTISPLLFFDPVRNARREPRASHRTDDAPAYGRRFFCARCRREITDHNQRIAVNGAHVHDFTNPNGIAFHIGCFRLAPGCAASGAATAEHTWFAGYAWRIADCGGCGVHLGWSFTSSADVFYGLIVDRLTRDVE